MPRRRRQEPIYTAEEANQALPWLTDRLRRISETKEKLAAAEEKMADLYRASRSNGHHNMGPAIEEARIQSEGVRAELQRFIDQIRERGIHVRDVDAGVVDFKGIREGREVWLCWQLGEPEVAHWHEINAGFAHRQPL
ncbi:MAG: DUF2203 domain-containing protein [Chloroflexota bacterium]